MILWQPRVRHHFGMVPQQVAERGLRDAALESPKHSPFKQPVHRRTRKAKIGRNPKDPDKDVPIPARAVVKFKPGKEMKEQVARTLPLIRERQK